MGSIRCYVDLEGDEQTLDEHEGFVLAELEHAVADYAVDGWTSSWTPETSAVPATGRHRPACECGWRGPIVDTGVKDVFLEDAMYDDVLSPWRAHTDAAIPLAGLRLAQQRLAVAQRTLDDAVAKARAQGASWSGIGDALGVSKQAVQQRYS